MSEVTLEMSLKPFKAIDNASIDRVITRMFRQWAMVIEKFDSVAVLLWSADGSELLDYSGDLEKTFEWAHFIGRANEFDGDWDRKRDPQKLSPHARRYEYTEHPVSFTYADLRAIVLALKTVGEAVSGKSVRVGTTLDPGPEFSISDFKYRRHPEVCTAGSMGAKSFMVSYETLHADDYPYRAYPEGIPEGLSLATFLGAQASCFMEDMGFDYLWLSNGFGFGAENWATTGPLFDGERFTCDTKYIDEVCNKTLKFWHDFREACPNFEVQTRGTNLSVGIDFATDGCATKAIYDGDFDLVPPPNSPWAALDKNFGLELAGFMSRIAELPAGKGYMYRYYLHDPWWINSPWFDRYEGEPHDIYLPLSITRLDESGKPERSGYLNILTVDTSFGEMPDEAVATVAPHLMRALDTAPDAVPPFVWVYPFEEYQTKDPATGSYRLSKAFFEDWFMIRAINEGLPVSGVISSAHFARLVEHVPSAFANSVLYVPVPQAGSPLERALMAHGECGGRAVVYGSLTNAGTGLRARLGVSLDEPLEGRFDVEFAEIPGWEGELRSTKLAHNAELSDGGIDTVLDQGADNTLALTTVRRGSELRVISVEARDASSGDGLFPGAGTFVWLRGTNDHEVKQGGNLLKPYARSSCYITSAEMRRALSRFGFDIHFDMVDADAHVPVITIHRHENAFIFSGYCRDTTVGCRMHFPLGVPVLIGHEVAIHEGVGHYHFPRSFRRECRVFVEQTEGVVSMTEYGPVSMVMRRRVLLEGLKDATMYVFPERNQPEKCKLLLNSVKPNSTGEPFETELVETPWGWAYRTEHVTGHVMVSTEFDEITYLEEQKGACHE